MESVDFLTQSSLKQDIRLAEEGDYIGQYNLGLRYYNGEGVSQDYQKAFHNFALSAAQGYSEAEYCLGVCYYYGEGVDLNFTRAATYFNLAADKGDSYAQNYLGIMYQVRRGCKSRH